MLVLLTLLVTLTVTLYYYLTWTYTYWAKRDVPHRKPKLVLGTAAFKTFLGDNSMGRMKEDYKYFDGYSYYGGYIMRRPNLVIRDPELIQRMAVKDFSSFHDNQFEVDEQVDPVMGNNPFAMRGEKWKIARNRLITQFSTGKIMNMFPSMVEAADKMVKFLIKSPDAKGKDGILISEVANKYTTDSVALCAFGIDAKSFDDPNSELNGLAKEMFEPGFIKNALLTITFFIPPFRKFINVKFIPEQLSDLLTTMMRDVTEYRKKNKITTNDFLDQMLKIKEKYDDFGEQHMLANIATFFTDGFLTSNSVISFTLYHIASQPKIYKKLQEEVDRIFEKYNGKFSYEALKEMKYLDCVFRETMRLYPPFGFLTKVCTQDTVLPHPLGDDKGPGVKVEKGTSITFPMWLIHRDPKYFKDPLKYDPDRFSDERIDSINRSTYFPFGNGPRICLGQRFAITQIKTGLAMIVRNLDFMVNKKTKEPIELNSRSFIPVAIGGMWLNFFERNHA